jgi:hypothetical protein
VANARGSNDQPYPVPDDELGDSAPHAAARLRDIAEGIASSCGEGVLRHLLEEEWRQAAERSRVDRSMPIADLEALLIFIAERIRREHGLDVLVRLLKDMRVLGETRENVDNHNPH